MSRNEFVFDVGIPFVNRAMLEISADGFVALKHNNVTG